MASHELTTDVYLEADFQDLPIPELQSKRDASTHLTLRLLWLECTSMVLACAPLKSFLTFHVYLKSADRFSCDISAYDCRNNVFHVRGLVSPIGRYSAALVRLGDTDQIDICDVSSELFSRLCRFATSQKSINCKEGSFSDSLPQSSFRSSQHAPRTIRSNEDVLFDRNPYDKDMKRYWSQRHTIFSRFSNIRTDREGLFSATPECVAQYVGKKILEFGCVPKSHFGGKVEAKCITIIDAFCGVGGNCIHLSSLSPNIFCIAIDIDKERLEMAKHNAAVYGVEDRIEFICGDFLQLAPFMHADIVILSPPWGGPNYQVRSDKLPNKHDLDSVITVPCDGSLLLKRALHNVAGVRGIIYMLPKDVRKESLQGYAETTNIEDIHVNGMKKMTISYHFM